MALPVLDGNQSATTLSSVVTGGEHIVAHSVVCLGSTAIANITNAVSGSVVSISNFPSTQTIAGTVTVGGFSSVSVGSGAILIAGDRGGTITPIPIDSGSGQVGVQLKQSSGPSIDPISQTNGLWVRQANGSSITVGNSVTIGSIPAISGTVTANLVGNNLGVSDPLQTNGSGAVRASLSTDSQTQVCDDDGNSYTIANPFPISGTVTANNPSGTLTTRFGSVTTASVAQLTSCVTNTSRKYLLAQNISAGTVTIGIGFSPTTTQGVQLPAGGGLTFDAFCPTGAIFWLGAVTGAAFTILEG